MNFDMKTTEKPRKNVVINHSMTTQGVSEKREQSRNVFVNAAGFGKAGNQAIQIMIAQGHFSKDNNTDLDLVLEVYKGLTKQIYKADLECLEELKNEL